MGEGEPEPARLPDFGPLDEGHDNRVAFTYMHMKANYELIIDNVMDLSHIDHVHGEIITTRGQLSPLMPKMEEGRESVSARREWKQTPAMLIFANFMPDPKAEARHFFDITWTPPANIQLSVGAMQHGAALDLEGCIGQYDLHTCTPCTPPSRTRTGPIIQAVHEEMGTTDFFSLNSVLMSNDVAPVKVRRLLKKLIEAETRP